MPRISDRNRDYLMTAIAASRCESLIVTLGYAATTGTPSVSLGTSD
jgi:hypothetical protein